MSAARHWTRALQQWAIPEDILAAAPESPWGFDVGLFSRVTEEALKTSTPSQHRALEALPKGGSVLDVGCGAGAASLPLAPPAARLTGVDQHRDMLAAFSAGAAQRGVACDVVEGSWPAVAPAVAAADVVVCHNVFYNVADLVPFARALHDHARHRVVVELTAAHPLSWTNPYWLELHGIARPQGPTTGDAVAVLRELGYAAQAEHWQRPAHWMHTQRADLIAFVRRRLCLAADRDRDIEAAIDRSPPPPTRQVTTVWWSPTA